MYGYFRLQLDARLWLQTQVPMLESEVSALPTKASSHPSDQDFLLFLGAED